MKKELKIGLVILLLVCLVLVSSFVILKQKNANSKNELIQSQPFYNNENVSVEISDAILYEGEKERTFILDQEETKTILNILENLNFKKETCDGIADYIIKVNNIKEDDVKSFMLEVYSKECHILIQNGEAVLTEEQSNQITTIINKYFKN